MKRRWLAPEVIQSSEMDCGPAALACLLQGHGISVSYGRLREACQTDVDGTSVDVLEDVARRLGLDVEQALVPLDHVLLPQTGALPALLVTRREDRGTHFVVVWRRIGNLVQVMDPMLGRRWRRIGHLLSATYRHTMRVPARRWREWAGSEAFLAGLRARLDAMEVPTEVVTGAAEDRGWRSLAALDASTRMVATLVRTGAIERGDDARRLLSTAYARATEELSEGVPSSIPRPYWSAVATPEADGVEQLLVAGAIVVVARGCRETPDSKSDLSPELQAALNEPPASPLHTFVQMLREDGVLTPLLLGGAVAVSAVARAVEALLLRGFLELGSGLSAGRDRIAAAAALLALVALVLALEVAVSGGVLAAGRRLEIRLRLALLTKIPRLCDQYFQSRSASDMAERAHAIHSLRQLPALGARVLSSLADLGVTAAALIWLDPGSAPFVVVAAASSIAVPLALQRATTEDDLRVRSYAGSLARFYLDALVGLVALRAHGAGKSLRREHDAVLAEYRAACSSLIRSDIAVDAVNGLASVLIAAGLVWRFLGGDTNASAALLLAYWALQIPAIGAELAGLVRQYPGMRNLTLRLLEPLTALEDGAPNPASAETHVVAPHGVSLGFDAMTVQAAGHTIVADVTASIDSGEHVAIVGLSGAGKSTLVGVLLGWYRVSAGRVLVDGRALDAGGVERLRRETAWIDPTVQLWDRTLLANLTYGTDPGARELLESVLETADLVPLVERLPDGLQAPLGAGAGLLSGGEGQLVRLGRALHRGDPRLVVLDEAFRGLDHERRLALLARVRARWPRATLLCVTHDVRDTLDFDRVLVLHEGRIVEDGSPHELAARDGSRFRQLCDLEQHVREAIWSASSWRRLTLRDGALEEAS